MIAITETWLDEDKQIELQGYVVFRNDRNEDGGGVMIAVREEIKKITTEIKRTHENVESLWILINNNQIKLRVGVVYFPQEKDQDVKGIYQIIQEQVTIAGNKDESIMVVGDYNCKVGKVIKGNHEKETKGGKKLMKFVEKEGLKIVNSHDCCKGIWTREENGVQSILDYVITDEEFADHVKEMKVHDSTKEISPFHLKKEKGGEIRTIYSDHNPITLKTDLVMMRAQAEVKKKKKTMTKEGREKYCQELQEIQLSKLWDKSGSLQEKYDKWERTVMQIRKKHEQVRKNYKKRISKSIR